MRHGHGELSEGCDEEVGETHGCWLFGEWMGGWAWGVSCCSWRWSSLCVVFEEKKGIIWEMEDTIYLLLFLVVGENSTTWNFPTLPTIPCCCCSYCIEATTRASRWCMGLGVVTGSGEFLPGRSWMDIVLLEVMEHILIAEREPYLISRARSI